MNARNFKAVIFDFDGTLYDNTGIAKGLLLPRLHRFFFMKAERKARAFFKGRDFETPENFKKEYYTLASKAAFCSPKTFGEWYEKRYLRYMEKVLSHKRFAAHSKIFEVFKAISGSGTKIALYSDYNLIKERALSCGVKQEALDLCERFYSSETLGCLKPAPRGFLQIAADLGAKPKETLVVGDRDDTDGQGARNAGMKFVQIKTKAQRPIWDLQHPVLSWEEFASKILDGSDF